MNINLLEEWIRDFKKSIEDWFKDRATFVKERYEKFPVFFQKIENGFDNFFDDFEEMCTWLHSLSTNNLALAQAQGRKNRNHTEEEYIQKIKFLLDTSKDVGLRLDKALDAKSKYKIKYFGQSSLTELITYNEPKKFIFLNQRAIQAIQILEAEQDIKNYLPTTKKGKSKGNYFKAFNEFIQEHILERYTTIIYNKLPNEIRQEDLYSQTTLMLEIDQLFTWIFEQNKGKEIKINGEVIEDFRKVDSCFIDSIIVKDFYSIKKLELEGLKTERFIFLLGENGSGKTVFLKALLIALKKAFIDDKADRRTIGIISEILKSNEKFELLAVGVDKEDTKEYQFNAQKETRFLKNVYAYGTRRNKISQTNAGEPYGFMTLFSGSEYDDDYYLRNIEQWLMEVERKELKQIAKFTIEQIASIIGQFLGIAQFTIEIKEKPKTHIIFTVDDIPYTLNELSEGYQSVLLLIIDMLSRLIDNNPDVRHTKEFYGVVLIDELDLFLHPKWEKSICHKLYKVFPNIQFFITTHSPILIDGATKRQIGSQDISEKITLVKLENQKGSTIITKEYRGEDIKHWNTNLLINSTAFDRNYLDDLPKEIAIKMNTANSEKDLFEMLKNVQDIRKNKSEAMKKNFFEILKSSRK